MQGAGNEFVDLIRALARHAAHDFAGGRAASGFTLRIGERVKECFDQADLLVSRSNRIAIDDVAIRVDSVDSLGQHGMAKAIDYVCKFGDDRGVNVGLDTGEHIDRRHDFARELFEH